MKIKTGIFWIFMLMHGIAMAAENVSFFVCTPDKQTWTGSGRTDTFDCKVERTLQGCRLLHIDLNELKASDTSYEYYSVGKLKDGSTTEYRITISRLDGRFYSVDSGPDSLSKVEGTCEKKTAKTRF